MENRGREILFLCLAVTALTTAIYTLRSNPGAHYTSPRQAAQIEAARSSAARGTEQAVESPKPRSKQEAEVVVTPLHRNPFSRPVGAPSAAPAPPKPQQPAQPNPQTTSPSPASLPMPPLAVRTPPAGTAAALSSTPIPPSLIGIVGDRSGYRTAVIRFGDRRYFAKQGDKVAGEYQVQSVSERQVVLVGADGKLILKMGGTQ